MQHRILAQVNTLRLIRESAEEENRQPRRLLLQFTIDANRHLLSDRYHGDRKALAAFKAAAAIEGLTAPPPMTKSTQITLRQGSGRVGLVRYLWRQVARAHCTTAEGPNERNANNSQKTSDSKSFLARAANV